MPRLYTRVMHQRNSISHLPCLQANALTPGTEVTNLRHCQQPKVKEKGVAGRREPRAVFGDGGQGEPGPA